LFSPVFAFPFLKKREKRYFYFYIIPPFSKKVQRLNEVFSRCVEKFPILRVLCRQNREKRLLPSDYTANKKPCENTRLFRNA